MSFFSKMFGGKKETTMTTGEAIQNLRETENMLIKKQEFLEKKIEDEIGIAKKNGTKNKRGLFIRTHTFTSIHRHTRTTTPFIKNANQIDTSDYTLAH